MQSFVLFSCHMQTNYFFPIRYYEPQRCQSVYHISIKGKNKPGPAKSAPYPRLKNSKRTSISHNAEKKLKGGPFGIFLYPVCRKTQKNEGGPFGEKKFRKKSLAVPKKIGRGDPLVSPGMVCYAGKQEKPFGSVR